MNKRQAEKMKNGKGFIAALDQSGGSTPKALIGYGIDKDQYKNDKEMFDLVHEMRSRIITSEAFSEEFILAAILFEKTMDSKIEGMMTADYLWEKKGIVSILKVDEGLAEEEDGVQLMKEIKGLEDRLDKAVERNIFGTKMRSVIKEANEKGIKKIVDQQFDVGKEIIAKELVPIIEPEVDINISDKKEAEEIMKAEILKHLDALEKDQVVMLKLTIPEEDGFYTELINHPQVMRVVALSGGHSREKSVDLLAKNPDLIASFSRALLEGLSAEQSDSEFDQVLGKSIKKIYQASIT